MALEPAKLSDFKLAGSLGTGATARVWEATHVPSGRPVAIKMMDDSGSSAEMRERFAREAILLSGVHSRHVSKIIGFGFEKGQPFLVLERLGGETLDAKLRRDGPVQPNVAMNWIEQLIVGIRDCHDAKVIHRDIKPSNIFLHRDGHEEVVKVIDFGVARLREITDEGSGGLTSANHLIGSMGYMAPEQFTNAKGVNFTADLYAVGVVVFRTLTGRLPFVSRSLQAIIKMKAEQTVPKISTMPGMPQNPILDWFVQKATAKDPNGRFQSAREMLDHWWNVMSSFDEGGATDIMRGARAGVARAAAASGAAPTATLGSSAVSAGPPNALAPPLAAKGASPPLAAKGASPPLAATALSPTAVAPPLAATALSPTAVAPPAAAITPIAPRAAPTATASGRPASGRPPPRLRSTPPSMSPATPPTPKMPFGAPIDPSEERTIHRMRSVARPAPPSVMPVSSTNEHTIHGPPAFLANSPSAQVADPDQAPHTERTLQVEDTAAYVEGADPFDLPTRSDPNLRKLVERELALQRARDEGKGKG